MNGSSAGMSIVEVGIFTGFAVDLLSIQEVCRSKREKERCTNAFNTTETVVVVLPEESFFHLNKIIRCFDLTFIIIIASPINLWHFSK